MSERGDKLGRGRQLVRRDPLEVVLDKPVTQVREVDHKQRQEQQTGPDAHRVTFRHDLDRNRNICTAPLRVPARPGHAQIAVSSGGPFWSYRRSMTASMRARMGPNRKAVHDDPAEIRESLYTSRTPGRGTSEINYNMRTSGLNRRERGPSPSSRRDLYGEGSVVEYAVTPAWTRVD